MFMAIARPSQPNQRRVWKPSSHLAFSWHTPKLSSLILWNARVTVSQSEFCLKWVNSIQFLLPHGPFKVKIREIGTPTKRPPNFVVFESFVARPRGRLRSRERWQERWWSSTFLYWMYIKIQTCNLTPTILSEEWSKGHVPQEMRSAPPATQGRCF
jgi:hypothetical protein